MRKLQKPKFLEEWPPKIKPSILSKVLSKDEFLERRRAQLREAQRRHREKLKKDRQ